MRNGEIDSRRLVTDAAIVAAIVACAPRSVLDIGCGEGWLARALDARGIRVTGVDAIPGLVERARTAGGGDFCVMSYEEIAAGGFDSSFDVVACNFALLGKDSVARLFGRIPALLRRGGSFVMQTLHPVTACGAEAYRDGWRCGSWAGFAADFTDPAPWYFRTLDSWLELFAANGLRVTCAVEPRHPVTQRALSVIFTAAP